MVAWYDKDWLGKDKPSKVELINDFYAWFFLLAVCFVLTLVFSVVSIVDLQFLGFTVMFGVLTILCDGIIHSIKKSYWFFYPMKKKWEW